MSWSRISCYRPAKSKSISVERNLKNIKNYNSVESSYDLEYGEYLRNWKFVQMEWRNPRWKCSDRHIWSVHRSSRWRRRQWARKSVRICYKITTMLEYLLKYCFVCSKFPSLKIYIEIDMAPKREQFFENIVSGLDCLCSVSSCHPKDWKILYFLHNRNFLINWYSFKIQESSFAYW